MKKIILFTLLFLLLTFSNAHADLINGLFLVNIEEVEIEGVIESRPALDEAIRDWRIIAREPAPGTRKVVHIIISNENQAVIDRLQAHDTFLGGGMLVQDAYQDTWDNHNAIAKHIIQCSWMDEDVLMRGSIVDWETTGSPERIESYIIPHVWAGGE